eukprot:COSAG01_NODE_969_length_12378_cov_41.649320_17_plen_51_part_00
MLDALRDFPSVRPGWVLTSSCPASPVLSKLDSQALYAPTDLAVYWSSSHG